MGAWRRPLAASILAVCASSPAAVAAPRSSGPAVPGHDRAFWRGIVQNRFEVPAGQSADALVLELSDYLGSPDPELRDDFAYSIAAAWIYRDRRVSEKTLHALLKTWTANLQAGLGGSGADTLFLRSFSALDAIVDRFDGEAVAREQTTFYFDEPAAIGRAFVTSIAHENRHLGELEYVKGLLGFRGSATR